MAHTSSLVSLFERNRFILVGSCEIFCHLMQLQTKLSLSAIRKYSSCIRVNEVYILSAVRTPIGCFQGKLAPLTAIQLGAKALEAAVSKAKVTGEDVQEIFVGNCLPTGLGQGPARQVALCGGLSTASICTSLNKLCSSGMKALMLGCQTITTMSQEVVAAVGMESLSNVPYMLRRKSFSMGHLCLPDLIFHDGLNDVYSQLDVTHFAEETVKEYKLTREEQDEYTIQSFKRALKARDDGIFATEIVPIVLKNHDKEETISEDEGLGRFNAEKLKKLFPETGKDGTITAGNASSLSDGAAAVILASGNFVLKKNLKPLGRVVTFADASIAPKQFCLSPAAVIPKVLVKANLTADDISLWEISETFALTVLLNTKLLKLKPETVNINGGSLSFGHPFGMTGLRIVGHLSHILKKGEKGCAVISHATGGGSAVIIEKM